MLLFLVSAACFLLLRLGHLSHSNISLAYTCESQVAFMSKLSKKLQPLADVTSPPYGSIGMVCMSNEEMDHLTSCFTNMVHFKVLQVKEGTCVERGVLLLRTLSIFRKFAQRWLHWRSYIGRTIDLTSLDETSSEFKGNSVLGQLLTSTLNLPVWTSLGVFIQSGTVHSLSFTDRYDVARISHEFCVLDRVEVQALLELAIDSYVNQCITHVWQLTLEASEDQVPSVSLSAFADLLKTFSAGEFEKVYYYLADGKDLSNLMLRIENLSRRRWRHASGSRSRSGDRILRSRTRLVDLALRLGSGIDFLEEIAEVDGSVAAPVMLDVMAVEPKQPSRPHVVSISDRRPAPLARSTLNHMVRDPLVAHAREGSDRTPTCKRKGDGG